MTSQNGESAQLRRALGNLTMRSTMQVIGQHVLRPEEATALLAKLDADAKEREELQRRLRDALCPMDCERWDCGPGGSDYDTDKPCTCGRVALVGDST